MTGEVMYIHQLKRVETLNIQLLKLLKLYRNDECLAFEYCCEELLWSYDCIWRWTEQKCKQELMPRQGVANETRGETHVEFWSLKIKEWEEKRDREKKTNWLKKQVCRNKWVYEREKENNCDPLCNGCGSRFPGPSVVL